MEISDTYVNTLSQLSRITGNLQQQKQLQQEIFGAAKRSRGNYSDMADTVAKLGTSAGGQFGNTGNLVKFTETMQKMFRVSGTGAQDQAGAWQQLQQSIGRGRLQGQDFSTLSGDAPLVKNAMAKYLGTSTGRVEELGSGGAITSQMLIDAILNYSQTVDKQISGMSYTWGDYWNEIKTGAMQAFGSVFENESGILNSQGVQTFVNGIVGGFGVLASAANGLLNAVSAVSQFFSSNWTIIRPIILGIAAALIVYKSILLICNELLAIYKIKEGVAAASAALHAQKTLFEAATAKTATGAQAGMNAALLASPITWIIVGIIAAIAALYLVVAVINKITGQSISATGIIVGSAYVIASAVKNLVLLTIDFFLAVWNVVKAVAGNIPIAFENAWADAKTGFWKFISKFLSGIQTIVSALNAIPGVNIDTRKINSAAKSAASKASDAWSNKKSYQDVGSAFLKGMSTYAVQSGWVPSAYNKGKKIGTAFEKSISDKITGLNGLTGLTGISTPLGTDTSALGTSSDPTTVPGAGSGGTVSVNIADQDLQYLRDLAEKDYIAKFSTATLAPNITVKINNSTSENLDGLKTRITAILQEGIAMAAEGNYV